MRYSLSNVVEDAEMAKGTEMSPSAYHSLLFNLKVNSGIYQKEKVTCFCGADNYREITNKDRYGIDYSLCLCRECGLLYSNPRMTDESFAMFYKDDYRNIYGDREEIGAYEDSTKGKDRIKNFVYDTLKEFEIDRPKIVFEIGCGTGSNLRPFKDDCQCIGVDYDADAIQMGKDMGSDLREGGIEVLESTGKKADLIIMNHVLEHMTDIESSLKRVREILAPDGLLYVAVPGIYTWDKKSLFQNAHNYQFSGNTLAYVMSCCGFNEFALDEQIESLWHKAEFADKEIKFRDEHRTIETFLTEDKFILPNIRMNCKFGLGERRENLKNMVASGIPEITELVHSITDSEAIVIGGGPSADDYVEKIKELKANGVKVFAIERMYKWCVSNGIIPDYVVALDASDDVIESFNEIHPDVEHLIVGHVKPDVIETLKGFKAHYFMLMQKGIDFSKIYPTDKHQRITFINSGSSVTLCCFSLAMTLGSRKFHVFGFDCHVDNKNYADGITGVGAVTDCMDVEIGDRTFKTTAPYFGFAQQFFPLYLWGKETGLIKDVRVYGDSLVKAMALIDIDGDKEDA